MRGVLNTPRAADEGRLDDCPATAFLAYHRGMRTSEDSAGDVVLSIADAWVDALARHDFERLGDVLEPAVQFRALVPGELVTVTGITDTVACFTRWFSDKTDFEVLEKRAEVLVDRLTVRFRARVRKNGESLLVEQTLIGDLEDGRFATLDLLCAGFRPEAAAASDTMTHVFDAGDLGCGTGLPREFRTRLQQIPVGHLLEVVTSDAAAKEDLPSLARLLGHTVRSVTPGADGKLRIQVERAK
jgi:TusA-related sulfurtransferase